MTFFWALYSKFFFLFVDLYIDNILAPSWNLYLITIRNNLIKDDAPRLCSRTVHRGIFYQTTAIRGRGPRSHLLRDLHEKSVSLQFFTLFSLLHFCPRCLLSPGNAISHILSGPKYAEYIIIVVLYTYDGALTDVLFKACTYIILFSPKRRELERAVRENCASSALHFSGGGVTLVTVVYCNSVLTKWRIPMYNVYGVHSRNYEGGGGVHGCREGGRWEKT